MKISVFDILINSIKTFINKFKTFVLLCFAALGTFLGALVITAIFNIPLYTALKTKINIMLYCTGFHNCVNQLLSIIPSLFRVHTLISILSGIFLITVVVGVNAGYQKAMLQLYDKGKTKIDILFCCFRLVPKLFFGGLIYLVMILFGLALLIIPGIVFAIRFTFFSWFIIDKDTGLFESFEKSWHLTEGYFWEVLALWFIAGIFSILGPLALISAVIMKYAFASMYRLLNSPKKA